MAFKCYLCSGAEASFDPVARNRIAEFLCHREADPCYCQVIGTALQKKSAPGDALTLPESKKIGPAAQALNPECHQTLCRKLVTALGTACRKNAAATNSGFARTETVAAFTLEEAGLECTFHGGISGRKNFLTSGIP